MYVCICAHTWKSCLGMLIGVSGSNMGFQHVGFWHAGLQLAAQVLFCHEDAYDATFSNLKISGWACYIRLQLHVELNIEHSTSLHCSSIHCGCWKRGRGLEIGLGYKWVKPLGLAMLEQLHAESNSERSQHLSSTLKLTAGCYIASRPCSCAIFLTMHKRKQTLNSLLL